MTVAARCAECNKGYRVDEKLAGRTLKCKACGGAVAVPATGEAPRVAQAVVAVGSAPSRRSPTAVATKPAASAVVSGDPFDNMDALLNLEAGGTVQDDGMPALAPPPLPRPAGRGGARSVAAIDPPAYVPAPTAAPPRRRSAWNSPARATGPSTAASSLLPLVFGLLCLALVGVFVVGRASDSFRPTGLMILLIGGVGLMLAGALGCLVTAFRESVVCGILYLFTPLGLYALYYIFTRLDRTKGYFAVYLIGLVCAIGSRGLQARPTAAPSALTGAGEPAFAKESPVSNLVRRAFNRKDHTQGNADAEAGLLKLHRAFRAYAAEHDGQYPSSLEELCRPGGPLKKSDLQSPRHCEYIFWAAPWIKDPLPPKLILVFELSEFDQQRPALYADGQVRWIKMSDWMSAATESNTISRELSMRR